MKVDTPYLNSWADSEFKRKHKPIIRNDITTNFEDKVIGWEKIHLPLPEWWGKPNILIGGITLKNG